MKDLKSRKKNENGKGTVSIKISDLEEAEDVATEILTISEKKGIGAISYYEDSLKTTIDKEGKSAPPLQCF